MADVSPSPESTEMPGLEIRSILLLDDDLELATTLKELLESRNYLVTTAMNGVEGLREVMDTDFDVIICDMMMPHMPGDMFYTAVERVKPHLCARFIFVTSYEGNPKIEAFFKKVNGIVLYKPTTLGKLMGTLNLLGQRLANAQKKASGAG